MRCGTDTVSHDSPEKQNQNIVLCFFFNFCMCWKNPQNNALDEIHRLWWRPQCGTTARKMMRLFLQSLQHRNSFEYIPSSTNRASHNNTNPQRQHSTPTSHPLHTHTTCARHSQHNTYGSPHTCCGATLHHVSNFNVFFMCFPFPHGAKHW